MAVALDAVSAVSESFFADNTSTPITIGSGSDRVLEICIICDAGGTLATPTVDGSTTGVTRIATDNAAGPGSLQLDWYYLVNPTAGARTLAITCAGASFVSIFGRSWTGVDQTTPFGTPVTDGADNPGPATVGVPTSVGDIVADLVGEDSGGGSRTISVGAGQTADASSTGNSTNLGASRETATGATTTMSWTLSASSAWVIAAAIVNPSSGGPSVPTGDAGGPNQVIYKVGLRRY